MVVRDSTSVGFIGLPRYTEAFKRDTLSLITHEFNMQYLAFLMFLGELTGMSSAKGHTQSLTSLYAYPEAGYVPFKICMQLNETFLDARPFNRLTTMSGAELVNDATVAKRYFVLFLQFSKKHPKVVALVFQ